MNAIGWMHGLGLGGVLASVPLAAAAQSTAVTYEYEYPYNTPDLIENHFLVLDSVPDGGWRGWYWGTSDEFDMAREGYLPGFFVAPLTDLRVTPASVSFTLQRPNQFFAAPVPLQHRDAADVPAGLLEPWTNPLTVESVRYTGTRGGDEIVLSVVGGDRVFRRVADPR